MATFPDITEAFRKTTGHPAVCLSLSLDEWISLWNASEVPVATAIPDGKTWEQNFREWYSTYRDGMIEKRDMEWIESVHPPITVEKWMRETGYIGFGPITSTLKQFEDQTGFIPKQEATSKL